MADPSGAWVLVGGPTSWPQTIERPLLLPLWPARQPPLRRPSRDSNVCIFGRTRNDTAGCVPVVHWSEQSLKECTPPSALERRHSSTLVVQYFDRRTCAREPNPRGRCARRASPPTP